VLGEYLSRDTKVSEFADVENVSIAALMHVFMHGRTRAATAPGRRPSEMLSREIRRMSADAFAR
jgi:hypothetical protein